MILGLRDTLVTFTLKKKKKVLPGHNVSILKEKSIPCTAEVKIADLGKKPGVRPLMQRQESGFG